MKPHTAAAAAGTRVQPTGILEARDADRKLGRADGPACEIITPLRFREESP